MDVHRPFFSRFATKRYAPRTSLGDVDKAKKIGRNQSIEILGSKFGERLRAEDPSTVFQFTLGGD